MQEESLYTDVGSEQKRSGFLHLHHASDVGGDVLSRVRTRQAGVARAPSLHLFIHCNLRRPTLSVSARNREIVNCKTERRWWSPGTLLLRKKDVAQKTRT